MTVTTTIFGMIISHMELQCIVYMTVGLDFLSTGPNWTPLVRREQYKNRSTTELALFPGPTQLSMACCTEKALNLSFRFFICVWGEPGNEAMTECELSNKYDRELCM